MRLYLVERNEDKVDWDEFDSVVVKAKNPSNAKDLAVKFMGYFSEDDVVITEIHLDDKEQIVHASFKAG